MPYSHPYKPNSGKSGGQGQPSDRNGQSNRGAQNRIAGSRTDDFVDNMIDLGTNLGAGVLGTISDALASAGDAISGWMKPEQELTFPQWRARTERKLHSGQQAGALAIAVAGACLTFAFGITALVMFLLSAVGPAALGLTDPEFMVFPLLMGIFTPLTVGFGIMTGLAIKKYRFWGRVRSYLHAARDWVCSLQHIAHTVSRNPNQVRNDLGKAIADGKLNSVFLSEDGDTIYFKEELYASDLERAHASQPAAAPVQAGQETQPLTPQDEFQNKGKEFLDYLKSCQGHLDAAADEELAAMHKNCGAILEFVRQHPDQLDRVRRFSEYYLPTTRKLLDTALGLGQVEAENAQIIRRDITGILHTLNTAYVRLYDMLLQDISMDVSTEIDTLEAMLRQDGLAGGFASDFGMANRR